MAYEAAKQQKRQQNLQNEAAGAAKRQQNRQYEASEAAKRKQNRQYEAAEAAKRQQNRQYLAEAAKGIRLSKILQKCTENKENKVEKGLDKWLQSGRMQDTNQKQMI